VIFAYIRLENRGIMGMTIADTPYGVRHTNTTPVTLPEAQAWHADLMSRPNVRGQLVDCRLWKAAPPEVTELIGKAMMDVRAKGLQRSAVVLSSTVAKMQISRLAKQNGMYAVERYIDASTDPNWEQTALNWIEKGIDPDK